MALRDFRVARREVSVGDTSLSLRGLSFAHLCLLLQEHHQAMTEAFAIVRDADAEDMGSLASAIAQAAPALVAHAIALAADEPDARDAAADLPADVQLTCLLVLAELTFTDPGALPKFMAAITSLMSKAASAATTTPSAG